MLPESKDPQVLRLLVHCGVTSGSEVISWADEQILQSTTPSKTLVDLALTRPEDIGSIITHLNSLAPQSDCHLALRTVLGELHHYLVQHPGEAERIVSYLNLLVSSDHKLQDEFSFIYQYDDAFLLARQGICGDVDSATNEFLDELQEFTEAAIE